MKIAIAIPTFNRVEYLKNAVQSVLDQSQEEDIDLYIVISNIASTDGTTAYLEQLNKDHETVIIYNQPEDNRIYPNPYFLASVIPEDIDWVWLMGDDDYLTQKNSVQIVSEHIKKYQGKDLCFLHACQGRRSRSTGQVRVAEIFDLCNELGYHEMLGWFSSIVLRRNEFVASMNTLRETHHYMRSDTLEGRSNYSAFAHSAAIYKQCVGKMSLFVDLPLAESQDQKPTEETAKRWAVENTSERYLFVADDLQRLREMGLIKHNYSRAFFKYLNWNFWDIWLLHLTSELINKKKAEQKFGFHFSMNPFDEDKTSATYDSEKFLTDWNKKLDRIMKVADFMENKTDSKNLSILYVSLKYAVNKLVQSNFSDEFVMSMLADQIKMLTVPCHDFEILNLDKDTSGSL
ncbi:MAG: glycosyltransferase [Verrucomicrobia bacterium]|nr:glycosyltransferase [Verrucomicrobiota bacterium]